MTWHDSNHPLRDVSAKKVHQLLRFYSEWLRLSQISFWHLGPRSAERASFPQFPNAWGLTRPDPIPNVVNAYRCRPLTRQRQAGYQHSSHEGRKNERNRISTMVISRNQPHKRNSHSWIGTLTCQRASRKCPRRPPQPQVSLPSPP